MEKKRLVVSYKSCSDEVMEAIKKKYPTGYNDSVIKVAKPNNEFFYAITVETADANYLVKVDVKIDNLTEEEFEKEFGEESAGTNTSDDTTLGREDDNIENIESTPETFDE